MKNKLYKTAKAVAPSLLLLLFLLPACSDESSNTPDIPETKYAKLTITLGARIVRGRVIRRRWGIMIFLIPIQPISLMNIL